MFRINGIMYYFSDDEFLGRWFGILVIYIWFEESTDML